jgi:hypothetical protein
MQAVSNKEYTTFRQLSLFNTIRLSSTSNLSKKLDKLTNIPDYINRISTLKTSIDQIENSIINYQKTRKEATPFSQLSTAKRIRYIAVKIFHFFNRTDYKIRTLQKSLPILLSAVDNKIQSFDEIDNKILNLPANQRKYSFKLRQISLFQNEFNKASPDSATWDDTAREVNEYIQNKFQQLTFGNDVAIQPDVYHSTRDPFFNAIVQGRYINQSAGGMRNNGTYLSTNIECGGYGPFAFAIDSKTINFKAVCYRPASYARGGSHDGEGKYDSIWICLKKSIVISPASVPLITVGLAEERRGIVSRLNQYNLNVPVVTRKACYRISELFEKVAASTNPAIPNFPSKWTVEQDVRGARALTSLRAV